MKSAELARLLPGVYRRTLGRQGPEDRERSGAPAEDAPGAARPSPLAAVLAVMEGLHAPCETALAELDRYFDPRRAPDGFVPFLARWVDLERYMPQRAHAGAEPLPGGTGRLRELVAEAAALSRWRGTARGLVRFLEVATGVSGFRVDESVAGPDGRPRPFHFRLHVPAAATPQERLVRRIVEGEKPAYVTWELAVEEGAETPRPLRTPKKARGRTSPAAVREDRARDGSRDDHEDETAEQRDEQEPDPEAAGTAADRGDDKES